ncbi:Arc domain-containing protein [Aurantimonas sp. C2-6-R+9]|uniref:Arc domain-containing protein n=1 Tax=unclassified Aurantimonas TaxID=2638230 RepID=UPI002E19E2C1|nr:MULTISPECIES: Arc domain-containing protein [unclassified Aurantimonas]MEC5293816.1 Arc domain-containing protein [Aurantimonas sp. C2-3-R2]MEC5383184.1 Arc domain-containing protein [Aurantimonas sp. C2-6-R+9]MEC5414199.1 Arc domain-containing protein [Aurantimonas sp. C2-4-R8]
MDHVATRKQLSTYLPADLKGWLENRSTRHFRSMNAELVAILSAARQAEDAKEAS